MIGYSKEKQVGKRKKLPLRGAGHAVHGPSPLTPKKRKPLKLMSPKQKKELAKRAKLRAELIEESGGLCMKCGNPPDKKDGWGELHLIHRISLAQGGKTNRENCYVGCRKCHSPLHGIKEV